MAAVSSISTSATSTIPKRSKGKFRGKKLDGSEWYGGVEKKYEPLDFYGGIERRSFHQRIQSEQEESKGIAKARERENRGVAPRPKPKPVETPKTRAERDAESHGATAFWESLTRADNYKRVQKFGNFTHYSEIGRKKEKRRVAIERKDKAFEEKRKEIKEKQFRELGLTPPSVSMEVDGIPTVPNVDIRAIEDKEYGPMEFQRPTMVDNEVWIQSDLKEMSSLPNAYLQALDTWKNCRLNIMDFTFRRMNKVARIDSALRERNQKLAAIGKSFDLKRAIEDSDSVYPDHRSTTSPSPDHRSTTIPSTEQRSTTIPSPESKTPNRGELKVDDLMIKAMDVALNRLSKQFACPIKSSDVRKIKVIANKNSTFAFLSSSRSSSSSSSTSSAAKSMPPLWYLETAGEITSGMEKRELFADFGINLALASGSLLISIWREELKRANCLYRRRDIRRGIPVSADAGLRQTLGVAVG